MLRMLFLKGFICTIFILELVVLAAQSSMFDLSDYQRQEGLRAIVSKDTLVVRWFGGNNETMEMRFRIDGGVPTISSIFSIATDGSKHLLAEHLVPEYRIVSGLRRVTQQQTEPLEELGIPLTAAKLDEIKWDAFWDAPLFISNEPPQSRQSSIPAAAPFANHPGMPRKESEIRRSKARFSTETCQVKTNGARIEIVFDGVTLGIFKGYLQYDIYKGTNLVKQTLFAKTENQSVAFKYDAGLCGLSLGAGSRVVWRDLSKSWQAHFFGSPAASDPVHVKSSNRIMSAEGNHGSIAVFPPPHSFYWARESEQNLGYSWYRKDDQSHFSFGIRQAEGEEDPGFNQNFALYNARPGSWQQMTMFLYLSEGTGKDAIDGGLSFTRRDRFKALPGYKVMGSHYHVGLVKRLRALGGLEQRINDVSTMKGIGVDIYGVIDGARGPGRKDKGEKYLEDLANYYEAARHQSDHDFLLMPNDENSTGGRKPFLGGHYDILYSSPVYWRPERLPGQPLVEDHPTYGKVYNLGTPADMMDMTERENALIAMPHPRSKRSTGYPDAIKDAPHFLHPNYFALGYRWGMGIDASARRLGEFRFLKLWDETNNWMAEHNRKPKYALAISEARSDYGHRGKPPFDDAYGMSPVNYVKIDRVPKVEDMSSVINALREGSFFVTSGEVLIPHYKLEGEGRLRTFIIDVEWTFPLEFIELVWGDGTETDRKIIHTTDLPAFGRQRFTIPFDASDKKWVRVAAWDVATNGAMLQPWALNY